jgi:hypothetical protein
MTDLTTTNKTTKTSFDADIEKLLQDAYLSHVRKSEEYRFGRIEERLESERETFWNSFEKVVGIAEAFFDLVKARFPEIVIKQYRIGIDYSSRIPAVIMLIDQKNRNDISKLRSLARSVEKASWGQGISECYIWTKVDENIEQELIETDFPFYRKTT